MSKPPLSTKLVNLEKVIQFARKNGFPDAHTLFWDEEFDEICHVQIDSATDQLDLQELAELRLGVGLEGSIFALGTLHHSVEIFDTDPTRIQTTDVSKTTTV